MTWSNDLMLSVRYTGKEINATWQHYIKSFCASMFLFCLRTFVWSVQSHSRGPGGAEPATTIWEPREETAHVVFSQQFLLWLQKRLHLYRPFHMRQHHPSLQTDWTAPSARVPNLTPELFWREDVQNQQCHWCGNPAKCEINGRNYNQINSTRHCLVFFYTQHLYV